MSSDHEAEIRASVAAHADLGPGYDDAVAEGLVERIGAEIDKRIDARLGPPVDTAGVAGPGPAGAPGGAGSAAPAGYQGYQAPAGYQGYLGPALPPGYQLGPPPVRPSSVGQRSVAMTITALGSMALGVGATAIVSRASSSTAQVFMVLLIWVAIAIVNIAYARRP
jgi:hypothetical protein